MMDLAKGISPFESSAGFVPQPFVAHMVISGSSSPSFDQSPPPSGFEDRPRAASLSQAEAELTCFFYGCPLLSNPRSA